MSKKIILASTSKYRKELLSRFNIDFETAASQVDEESYKSKQTDPKELAQVLAKAKAKSVFESGKNQLVIGSDQVCHFQGEVFDKPGNQTRALEVLKQLSGQTHELITAYTIMTDNEEITHTNITKLTMKPLGDESLKKYLREDNPIDCAGSYKLELKGICLFSSIESEDHTAIIGLPLIQLAKDLDKLGTRLL